MIRFARYLAIAALIFPIVVFLLPWLGEAFQPSEVEIKDHIKRHAFHAPTLAPLGKPLRQLPAANPAITPYFQPTFKTLVGR